jgi:TRAP-type C4-dicarboxylate transport system permease large subunit
MRGGLAHVNIIGSVIFAGMSGTAIADAAGLGTIEIKAMQDHGYDDRVLGRRHRGLGDARADHPAVAAVRDLRHDGNVSIGALFLGGVIPGAVMTLFMMLYVAIARAATAWAATRRFAGTCSAAPSSRRCRR